MKNNNKIIIFIFILLFLIFISISIFLLFNTQKNEEEILAEKANSQILYLDNEIIDIANLANNINLNIKEKDNLNKNTNWEEIELKLNSIYEGWNSIIIDLNSLGIKNTDLTNFGRKIDDVMISSKNQDKANMLNNLCELYYFLVIYANSYNSNEELKNNIATKYYLLKSYSALEKENWIIAKENIIKAENSYYNNINNIETNNFYRNKTYVSIKELENIVNSKNIDIYYLKYIIVLNNIKYQ